LKNRPTQLKVVSYRAAELRYSFYGGHSLAARTWLRGTRPWPVWKAAESS